MNFKSFLSSSFLLAVLFFCNGFAASAMTLPGNPDGYVNDFADILTTEEESELELLIGDLEQKDSSEIAIVTINSLDGEVIEEYAFNLFNEWGIGKKEEDNGVMILVAIEDREVRIEVGYGLEGALTDYESKLIIEDVIVPAFQDYEYMEGLSIATNDVISAIEGEYEGGTYSSSFFSDPGPVVSILMIVFGFPLLFLFIIIIAQILNYIFTGKFLNIFSGGGGGSSGSSSGYGGSSSSGSSSSSSSSSSSGSSFGGGSSGGGGASGKW